MEKNADSSIRVTYPRSDEDAIRALVLALQDAFATKNAAAFAVHLAEDADWENAFGRRAHGRAEIEAFLADVFPRFSDARITGEEIRIRPVSSDVAVVDSVRTVTGQRSKSDEPMAARLVRTSIVVRKDDGRWMAVVYRVADLRDPTEST
jgi:uncharacterized protein (TIGR02246 family)